ncbi:MAG: hypothetical protein M1826_001486 [Phylliscum demangeonii]|nr:MAG: hypothetical protein M1826_001486 [Phylliscum demangeonii]
MDADQAMIDNIEDITERRFFEYLARADEKRIKQQTSFRRREVGLQLQQREQGFRPKEAGRVPGRDPPKSDHHFDRSGTGYIEPSDFKRIIMETARHKLSKVSYADVRADVRAFMNTTFVVGKARLLFSPTGEIERARSHGRRGLALVVGIGLGSLLPAVHAGAFPRRKRCWVGMGVADANANADQLGMHDIDLSSSLGRAICDVAREDWLENTNHESVAYRSFSPSRFTGILPSDLLGLKAAAGVDVAADLPKKTEQVLFCKLAASVGTGYQLGNLATGDKIIESVLRQKAVGFNWRPTLSPLPLLAKG